MSFGHEKDEALGALAAGRPTLVWSAHVSDLETPVSAFLKLGGAQRPGAFLLESVQGGDWRGRYSIIGLDPDLIWRVRDGRPEISTGSFEDNAFEPAPLSDPIADLRRLVSESAVAIPAGLPPPSAGLFGYLSYDMVRYIERLPGGKPDPIGGPEAILARPTIVAVFDNIASEITLVAVARPDGRAPEATYDEAIARLAAAAALLEAPIQSMHSSSKERRDPPPAPTSNIAPEHYKEMVERAKAYARAGDIFQVVPSQRFSAPLAAHPFSLYRALRRLNPSPFLFYFGYNGFSLVGSSPEILVRVRDRLMTVRPIAGTRPRGTTASHDAALEQELLADPKERSEHLMLLDLGRNDVGKVAATKRQSNDGGVRVTQQFAVERYSHVMHIVSSVEGRLRHDVDPVDALFAGFPAGTVSGAPKVRAMEIIDELEPHRRGIYAGGVGYISAAGDIDMCIALRTGVVADGVLHVQAGGGVVLDSDPQLEWEETIHKSKALFRAAAECWRYE